MLGQPVALTLPQVVGCKLEGSINPLTTSIDVVLGITKVTNSFLFYLSILVDLFYFIYPTFIVILLSTGVSICSLYVLYLLLYCFYSYVVIV